MQNIVLDFLSQLLITFLNLYSIIILKRLWNTGNQKVNKRKK